ncbi:MAG: biotin synthase BioB [Myxococcota bacterium]|nr:biotin synthase BioB [Myxococcota bacterium]
MSQEIRNDWELAEVQSLYRMPLLDLVFEAAGIHRRYHDSRDIQKCTLVSVKTGACPEDCSYCSQSSRNQTDLERMPLMSVDELRGLARQAREAGATRLCMGAAWRSAKKGKDFQSILEMVKAVNNEGLESCVTLGMLTREQAFALKEAGLTTYNHNLDTSREYYPKVITTRTYDDRLETLSYVREAGLGMCTGGIIGMGETPEDRVSLLHTLATLAKHPDSVPVNMLVPVEGTPLADTDPIDPLELVRTIAVARILMPACRVRLSAGRKTLTREAQTLAFLAGANSIFFGDKLLTTPNNPEDSDTELFDTLGV